MLRAELKSKLKSKIAVPFIRLKDVSHPGGASGQQGRGQTGDLWGSVYELQGRQGLGRPQASKQSGHGINISLVARFYAGQQA